jgi:protein-disulfide isomerase/serine/threonine protein kinase
MSAAPRLAQLSPGQVFAGDFRVVRALAEGGMGAIYVAEQLSTGNERALKLMLPQLVADEKLRQRFEQEARVGARIESDHVVQVVAAGIDAASGTPWLAMELLKGETLAERVARDGPRPHTEVREMFAQLCHALAAAHDVGVVHRDLKPENVFLAAPRHAGVPFTLKVLDFGIAKLVAEASTKHTAAMGSPLWMAPEQTESGRDVSAATDIWALGLVAFYVLTGRVFWRGAQSESTSVVALIREIAIEPMPSASARATEYGAAQLLPHGFDAWFARAAAREPLARFATVREARAALDEVLEGRSRVWVVDPLPGAAPVQTTVPAPTQLAPVAPIGSWPQPPSPAAQWPRVQPVTPALPPSSRRSGVWLWPLLVIGFLMLLAVGSVFAFVVAPKYSRHAAKDAGSTAPIVGAWSDSDSPIPVSAADPTWGDRTAPVTMVEFSDFQCPFCKRASTTVDELERRYGPSTLRVVWKSYPLSFHNRAEPAAEAGEGVFEIGGSTSFWTFHAQAYGPSGDLSDDALVKYAGAAGVTDEKAIRAGLLDHRWKSKVDADAALATKVGVSGTPAFFVNGVMLSGAQPVEKFVTVIDAEKHKADAKIASGTPRDRVYVTMSRENKTAAPVDAGAPAVPEDSTTVHQVPVAGSPVRGNPTALVTLVEFGDFQCPFSARVEPTLDSLRAKYGEKLRIVWKNTPLPFHPRAEPAAEAALEVRAERGDAAFWTAHDAIFAGQKDLSDSNLIDIATRAGAQPARVNAAIAGKKHDKEIVADQDVADDFEVSGTPNFFINGRHLVGAQPPEKFEKIIDEEIIHAQSLLTLGTRPADLYAALLKGGKGPPSPETKALPASLPAGAPVRGNVEARVAVHEWADFQCPYCGRVEPTLVQLMKDYGDRIKLVWHDLPLAMHADAPLAAQAAREALHQRGPRAFWSLHDTLYADQSKLSRLDLDADARTLGLDMTKWKTALDDATHAAEVESDRRAASDDAITGTPSFIVVVGGASSGYYVSGAQAYTKFRKIVARALADAGP